MTNAEARFNKSLRPRKPEGSLGRTDQDVHLDSHTAPELCGKSRATVKTKTATVTKGVNNSVMILIHIARGKGRATIKTETVTVTEGLKKISRDTYTHC